ncbi:hypothetical protein SK128_014434 [Halocaridina rubra]|uniref:C-type lectin domain-containing protein n=1 Tax=Halocaridina rubra TaxID=373956 RepID=A0AAN8WJY7_HALRR
MKKMGVAFFAFLVLFCSRTTSLESFIEDWIECNHDETRIPRFFVCDRGYDCPDRSDEDNQLCETWLNSQCSKNEVQCQRGSGKAECISINEYCTSENPRCQGELDRRVCEMLKGGKLDDLDNFVISETADDNLNKSYELAAKFQDLLPYTLRHRSCPPMYTLVGGQCISIFHIGGMTWAEAREFCKIISGDLITFQNVSQYAGLVRHLQLHGKYHRVCRLMIALIDIKAYFWIGGNHFNKSEGWRWIDGTPMELGSPYWATRYSTECVDRNVTVSAEEEVCFQYYQGPEEDAIGQCVALDYEHYFYMSDENCIKGMSPICMYMGSTISSRFSPISTLSKK